MEAMLPDSEDPMYIGTQIGPTLLLINSGISSLFCLVPFQSYSYHIPIYHDYFHTTMYLPLGYGCMICNIGHCKNINDEEKVCANYISANSKYNREL